MNSAVSFWAAWGALVAGLGARLAIGGIRGVEWVGIVIATMLVLAMLSYRLGPNEAGLPRVVEGPTIPVLYPGERASARFSRESFLRAMAAGKGRLEADGWLVEPAPGTLMAWKRIEFRLFGWWWYRLTGSGTMLEVTTSEGVRGHDDDAA
jgi:di/tricarboxylate transporter